MASKIQLLRKIVLFLILVWSAIIVSILFTLINENYNYADRLAKQEAITSVDKDLAYRSWVSSHGGVYVPITEKTPPNPYLAHIKNRDITTSDNQNLTLMNPAYTLSQMMKDYTELYGRKGHITSLKPLNPKNKADEWETNALKLIETGKKPVYEKSYINDKEYMRYINPLIVKQSCLKCHAFQGYQIGEVRGAVSVSIPMKTYQDEAWDFSVMNSIVTFIIWIIGLLAILYGERKTKGFINEKIKDYEQNLYSLINMIEQRDSYTAGHNTRVAQYSVLIAKEMKLSKSDIDDIYRAAMLHDIGKVAIPDTILLKPGKLTKEEYQIIQNHVVLSYEILKDIDIYKNIAEIVRYHHEHYDGSGYPQGLRGDDIPLLSQIMTLADTFDAMTTHRIYKARKTVDNAFKEIKELSDKQFNAKIVEAALVALNGIEIDGNISQKPVTDLEKERLSYYYKDQLTKTYTHDYLAFILSHNDEFNIQYIYGVYLHDFSTYNEKYGWEKGNEILAEFAHVLNDLKKDNYVVRIHGDDFVILTKEQINIEELLPQLQKVFDGSTVIVRCKDLKFYSWEVQDIDTLEKIY